MRIIVVIMIKNSKIYLLNKFKKHNFKIIKTIKI